MGVPRAIRLVCSSWDQLGTLLENDLRRGICRVRLPKQPPIGTDVKIDLGLPSGTSVAIGGQIRGYVPSLDDPARGYGIEVLITSFPPDALFTIEASLRAAREPVPRQATADPESLAASALGPDSIEPLQIDTGLEVGPGPMDTWVETTARGLLEELRAEKRSLEAKDPFARLGVRFDASDEEVKGAFLEASKRYSPDQLARYDGDEAKALAGEIYMLLRDAYRKIGDHASRETTRALLGGAPKPAALTPPILMPEATPEPQRLLSFRPSTPPPAPPSGVGDELDELGLASLTAIPTTPKGLQEDTIPAGLSHDSLFGDLDGIDDAGAPPSDRGLRASMLDAPSPEVMRANALLDSGHVDEAILLFNEFLKNRPRDVEARAGKELAFGYRCLKTGDRLAAARHFEKALAMIPANERAAKALDLTRRSQGQSGKGILDRLLGKK